RESRSLLDSTVAELLLAGLSLFITWFMIQNVLGDDIVAWYESTNPQHRLALAGWWYAFSTTLLSFLFLRWAWRYGVWSWFLFRMSRIDLRLALAHPDHS